MHTVMKFRFPYNAGNLLTSWGTVKFYRGFCSGELIGLLVWFSICSEHGICKRCYICPEPCLLMDVISVIVFITSSVFR